MEPGKRGEWSRKGRVEFSHELDLDDEITFENEYGQLKTRPFSGKRGNSGTRSPNHSASSRRSAGSSRPTSGQFWGSEANTGTAVRKRQLYRMRSDSPTNSVRSTESGISKLDRFKQQSPVGSGGRSTFFSQMVEGSCSPTGQSRRRQRSGDTDTANTESESWSPAAKSLSAKQRLQGDVEHLTHGEYAH